VIEWLLTNSAAPVLKTGLVSAASGSAYLELEAAESLPQRTLISSTSSLKLTCSVHGPKPVARTTSFSPNLQLTAHVKFAPFAARQRRGYIRDAAERDLSVHLETALKGIIIPDRWPKSAIEVIVTVLEGEEDSGVGNALDSKSDLEGSGMMNVLAGCLTVASAALADARIDCLDLLAGGVAAIVPGSDQTRVKLLDPRPTEHEALAAICVVGYLPTRDEITELWLKGDLPVETEASGLGLESLIDGAINAAKGVQAVLQEAVRESAEQWVRKLGSVQATMTTSTTANAVHDVKMKT
jgi:exosome complex component MTR3